MAEKRTSYEKWFIKKVNRLNDSMEKMIEELVDEGQQHVYETIETSGTGKTWKRTYYRKGVPRRGSLRGRVWTGEMRGDVEQDVMRNDEMIKGSFGWLRHVEDYYLLQEGGFDHPVTGEHIPGMFAMADAADWAGQEFKRRARGVIREF